MGLTEEQKQCYTKFFKAADKDNSGHLTVQELRNIIQKDMNLQCSDAEVVNMFADVDANNDKKISLEEFLTEMGKVNPKDLKKADFERVFKSIDRDNNRTLDCGELKKLFSACGHRITDNEVESIIQKLDKDGSGSINFDEFLVLFS